MKSRDAYPRFHKLEPALRHRIVDAALREFGSFGYGSASMNRLVKRAGISKGAIFKYFGTKAGVFDYVYRSSLEEVKGRLREVRDNSRTEPFFQRLQKVLRSGLEFTTRMPFSAALYYRVIYTGDAPHGKRILTEIQGTSRRFLQTLIEDGVKNGELRSGIDIEKTAFMIQSVLDRFFQAHYLEFMTPSIEGLDNSKEQDSPPVNAAQITEKWIWEITDLFRVGLENGTRSVT